MMYDEPSSSVKTQGSRTVVGGFRLGPRSTGSSRRPRMLSHGPPGEAEDMTATLVGPVERYQ